MCFNWHCARIPSSFVQFSVPLVCGQAQLVQQHPPIPHGSPPTAKVPSTSRIMKATALCSSSGSCRTAVSARPARSAPAARPFTHSRVAPQPRRAVAAHFFKFGKNGANAEEAGIVGSQGRDEYTNDDVEQYFNYMGFLATEGTYDRMEALMKSGLHPVDIILILACAENDTPKIQEILGSGADPTVKGLDGKTPLEIATKPELQQLLKDALSKRKVAA